MFRRTNIIFCGFNDVALVNNNKIFILNMTFYRTITTIKGPKVIIITQKGHFKNESGKNIHPTKQNEVFWKTENWETLHVVHMSE